MSAAIARPRTFSFVVGRAGRASSQATNSFLALSALPSPRAENAHESPKTQEIHHRGTVFRANGHAKW
jgi:hypothetical protein